MPGMIMMLVVMKELGLITSKIGKGTFSGSRGIARSHECCGTWYRSEDTLTNVKSQSSLFYIPVPLYERLPKDP